jgi:hypothetical protein
MPSLLEAAPHVVRPAQPDPLPLRAERAWSRHAPWVATVAALAAATSLLDATELGLLASGAGTLAVLHGVALGRLRQTCLALHLSAGVLLLALSRGATEAGSFAPAAAIVLAGAMLARAAALRVRPAVAPLAGRLPWEFRRIHRRIALRFGLAGLAAGVLVALLVSAPLVRIAAVALLPLALRTFVGTLLSPGIGRLVLTYTAAMHVAVLVLLLPAFGAPVAAWSLVGAETLLFVGSALIVARRTGVTPFPTLQLGALFAAIVLLATVCVPGTPQWPLLVLILCGVALGAVLFPRMQRTDEQR